MGAFVAEAAVKAAVIHRRGRYGGKRCQCPAALRKQSGGGYGHTRTIQAAAQVRALSSERVRASRILIRLSPAASENERKRALKTAQALKKRLDEGEDFSKIAKEESEDPETAARGGDIGYVLRGVAPPEMEKAVFGMEVGQTSQPILTELGYNILRVVERRAAETPDFDRFKDDLISFLSNMNFRAKLDDYVKTLRARATIERHLTQ